MSTELSTPDDSGRETGLTPMNQDKRSALLREILGNRSLALHNFPDDPQEQFFLTSDALGDDCEDGSEWQGQFRIRHFYCHPVEVERDGGELVSCIRTVLIDPDGAKIKFVSDGIANDVGRIAACFGFAPYDPPVVVEVRTVKTGRGRRLLRLQPVRTKQTGK